jgi:hypothetical protein
MPTELHRLITRTIQIVHWQWRNSFGLRFHLDILWIFWHPEIALSTSRRLLQPVRSQLHVPHSGNSWGGGGGYNRRHYRPGNLIKAAGRPFSGVTVLVREADRHTGTRQAVRGGFFRDRDRQTHNQGESVFRLRNFSIVGFLLFIYCATCFGPKTIFWRTYFP